MMSTDRKLILPILFAVLAACYALIDEVPSLEDAVTVKDADAGIIACQGRICQKPISYGALAEEVAQYYREPSMKSADTEPNPEVSFEARVADRCSATVPVTNLASAYCNQSCPRCTWEDGDKCCPACLSWTRVQGWIPYGRERCWVISMLPWSRYQYVQRGTCREPNKVCQMDTPYCHPFNHTKCEQKYTYKRVVCLKFNFNLKPFYSYVYTTYKYPSTCTCTKRGALLPYKG